ncbi:hypothetical protein IU12_10720, partial [Mycobacterium tuberculosis]
PVAISGLVARLRDEGTVAGGVLGAGVPLGTISHGPAVLGAPAWKPPHPLSDSITAATKAPARNQTLTRGHPFQQTFEKT